MTDAPKPNGLTTPEQSRRAGMGSALRGGTQGQGKGVPGWHRACCAPYRVAHTSWLRDWGKDTAGETELPALHLML